jgi:hypothetical protein
MICARLRRRRSVEIEVIYFDKKLCLVGFMT